MTYTLSVAITRPMICFLLLATFPAFTFLAILHDKPSYLIPQGPYALPMVYIVRRLTSDRFFVQIFDIVVQVSYLLVRVILTTSNTFLVQYSFPPWCSRIDQWVYHVRLWCWCSWHYIPDRCILSVVCSSARWQLIISIQVSIGYSAARSDCDLLWLK